MSGSVSNYILSELKINGFKVTPQNVAEIQIYEGLTIPAITGKMFIADREALLEIHEVFAGDSFELQLVSIADKTDTITYKGVISSAAGSTSNDHTFPVTIFEFCDEWWFNAITMQFSKAYKNMTWIEMVRDLIEICGGKLMNHEPAITITRRIERYVTPKWTPAHTIKEILSWAGANNEYYNFMLYSNLIQGNTIYWDSLDDLVGGKRGVHKSDLLMGSPNIHYEGNLNTIYLESYYDSLRYVNQGAYKTDYIAFDYDHTSVYKASESVEKLKFNHLAANMPMNKAHTGDLFTSETLVGPPFAQQKRITSKDFKNHVENLRNRNYSNLFTDMIKFNMMVPGASDRACTQLVKLKFPSINSKSKNELVKHKGLEGLYLIRNICHIIKSDSYNQALTLVRDGFEMMNRTDLVKWENKTDIGTKVRGL